MSKSVAVILAIIFVAAFMAGCTSNTGSSTGGVLTLSAGDRAIAEAAADKTNDYAFKFAYGENQTPFSGTVSFISKDGSSRVQFHVPGGLVINRSEICGGSGASTGPYTYLLVTFDDSPVNETLDWSNVDYCASYYFYPDVNDSQMQEIRDPPDPTYTSAAALAYLYPDKVSLTFTVGEWGNTTFDAIATFITTDGQSQPYQTASGALLINRSVMCDSSGTDRFSKMNVTFNDSPVGETWSWDADYCGTGPNDVFVTEGQMSSIKNPIYDISLFEYENYSGQPVNSTLYCGDKMLGTLLDGHLNISKVELLNDVGANCLLNFRGNVTIYNRQYGFDFCGWNITDSSIRDYGEFPLDLNDTILHYFRTAPCSTASSFITPEDSMVQYRLNRYLPYKSADTSRDIGIIFDALANEFKYNSSKESEVITNGLQDLLPTEFFESNSGVCVDWSNAFLSLVLARDPTTPCYVVDLDFIYANGSSYDVESHADVLCAVGGVPKVYDQVATFSGSSIWSDAFDSLDWKTSTDPAQRDKLSNLGLVGLKPTAYYNDKTFVEVNSFDEMYSKLGIHS